MVQKTSIKRAIFLVIFIIYASLPFFAEQVSSTVWDYSLDLPEGYTMVSHQGSDRFQFEHSVFPVSFLVASYEGVRYDTAKNALQDTYQKLQANGDIADVMWRNANQCIGRYDFALNGVLYEGWAVSVMLPKGKGSTILLAYAPIDCFDTYEQLIISTLDSFCIDQGSYYEAGIITQYAFPKEGDISVTLELGEESIDALLDKSDVAASEYLVNREYLVLKMYANSSLWQEAWQRYYRMIYRDSYKRLERVSFSLYSALSNEIRKEGIENFDTILVQKLLRWVQGFDYERIPLGTDFSPLPAIIMGEGSDCDSRALLLCVLLHQMRYDTMLFVSREYSHALFGIMVDGAGARLEVDGRRYLLGETTSKVNLGLIPQNMSEESKWIAIEGL